MVVGNEILFFYGFFVSLLNIIIQNSFYFYHEKQVSKYPSQALIIVVTSTIMRVLIVGSLLLLGFKYLLIDTSNILLGFILGQVIFLIHQLLVTKNNGK